MANKDKNEQNVDPTKLDNLVDNKYAVSLQDKADLLNEQLNGPKENGKPDFRQANDGVSSIDEEGVINDNTDNVSEEEKNDLEEAASRMPQQDDILDQEFLDQADNDGSPLNESDESLGDDLDISPDDADANIYDDNE